MQSTVKFQFLFVVWCFNTSTHNLCFEINFFLYPMSEYGREGRIKFGGFKGGVNETWLVPAFQGRV